jgi:iron complex outermembrane recepter protein
MIRSGMTSTNILGRGLASASLLALCVGTMAAPAFAQTAPAAEADEGGLGDIIVQARKVDENLQDVPVAVTVLSGADLQAQNAQKVQDIARFTPGLTIRPGSSTPSAITITLRGQVQTDILATLDPSVGTYVDGVYWARSYGLNGDFLDTQSVQVLKGPQGTLFGRNTTGGALLINSNDPDASEFSGRISATYGRFNEMQGTAVLNAPLAKDRVAIRLAAQRTKRDGFTTNVAPATARSVLPANTIAQTVPLTVSPNGLKYDNKDRWQFRGKLLVKATDNLSFTLSGEYFDMDERGPARELLLATSSFAATNGTYNLANTASLFTGVTLGNGPAAAFAPGQAALNTQIAFLAANPSLTSNNEVPYSRARTNTYNFITALDTSFGQIKFIANTRKVRSEAGVDLEGSSIAIHFTEGLQRLKQQSAELQITGKSGNVDFAAGGFVFSEKGFDQSISITVPLLNPNTSHFYGLINNDSIGVYGQASWHISDQLTFTGGVRYSADDKGLESRNNNYNRTAGTTTCSIQGGALGALGSEVVGPAACAIRRRDSFSGWSYMAGLDYKISDDILIYAKTSKGFRSGGQNLRAPNPVSFIPFQPEIAYSHEIGLKSEFLDNRVRLNLAAYRTDVSNIQRSTLISTGGGGTATILGNAGKARFTGVEAEFQALVFEGFRVSATGNLTDPKYITYADLAGDRSFERFSSVSKSSFTFAGDYAADIGSGKLKLRVDYSWLAKQASGEYNWVANPATPAGPPLVNVVNAAAVAGAVNVQNAAIVAATTKPSQGLLGARASVSFNDDMYELAIFGRNLTNNRDFVNNLLVAPLGYVSGVRQEPRTYGVTASVKF